MMMAFSEAQREKVRAESGDWSLVEEMKGTSWIDGGGNIWSQSRAPQVDPLQPFGMKWKCLMTSTRTLETSSLTHRPCL